MKKILLTVVPIAGAFLILFVIYPRAFAQDAKQEAVKHAIPENVLNIAKKSCVTCHTEGGNGMALMHVNLSEWDKLTPAKQAEKAKSMCNMVTKDKMPPKSFREKHPEGVPTPEEVKIICDWAQSIQPAK